MNIQEYEKMCLGGAIIITPTQFTAWLEKGGYKDFNAKSSEQLKNDYHNAGKPIETDEQILDWIIRLNNNKNGKLILAKAQTEIAGEKVDRWELFQQAKKAGKCLSCGWIDGDGTKACYYDKEVGVVTHENSWSYVLSQMTESQRSLVESYDSIKIGVYDDASLKIIRPRLLSLVRLETDELLGKKQWHIGCCVFDTKKHKNKEDVVEAWLDEKKSLDAYLVGGWLIKQKHEKEIQPDNSIFAGMDLTSYDIQKPHSCGGYGRHLGPYHIGCTKCHEEVKLWEFGIDYDVG